MKNETHEIQTAPNFKSVKEVEAQNKVRMEKVLSGLQHEMAGIRTGRASVSLFDTVRVDYYGTLMPLNQVATLHVPEPAMITVQPFDSLPDHRNREGDPRSRLRLESVQ